VRDEGVLDPWVVDWMAANPELATPLEELDPEILRHADLLVVDSLDQCLALGELQHAPEQAERAIELGRICAGEHPGRTGEGQLTVCDLTGLGAQDVAAANVVMARAGDRGDTLAL